MNNQPQSGPAPLEIVMALRVQLRLGLPLKRSLDEVLCCRSDDYSSALKVWLARTQAGQDQQRILKSLPILQKTSARSALLRALNRGLNGAPMDEMLAHLELEFFTLAELAYEKHLQILPFKLLVPLALFVLPGVLLLMLAPLLNSTLSLYE
jgi:hypothetical protein